MLRGGAGKTTTGGIFAKFGTVKQWRGGERTCARGRVCFYKYGTVCEFFEKMHEIVEKFVWK